MSLKVTKNLKFLWDKNRQKFLSLAVSLLIFTSSVLGGPWLAAEQVSCWLTSYPVGWERESEE